MHATPWVIKYFSPLVGGTFSSPMGGLFPSVGEALLVCVWGGGAGFDST